MKERGRFGLLFLAMGGVELSWLYAWATFLTMAIFQRPFPLLEAVGTFGMASLLTMLSTGKGWRVISILVIQALGLMAATLRMIYAFHSSPHPFLDSTWIMEFFHSPRGPMEWFYLVLILFWVLIFWIGGVALARRSPAYLTVCSRFDLGIVAFFILYLVQLLLRVKGEVQVSGPASPYFLCPFFVFSLLAIGLVRNRSANSKNFLPGFQGIGVILSFTAVVFLFGAGLVLFSLPYLTQSAEAALGVLQVAGRPLAYIFVEVIRFIFMRNVNRPEPPSAPPRSIVGEPMGPTEHVWWSDLLEKILAWVVGSLVGLVTLIFLGVVVFYLVRWLLSKTPAGPKKPGPWGLILWAQKLKGFLFSFIRKIVQRLKGYERAVQLYAALLHWGHHSGLRRFISETPAEYGARLRNHFPALKREIETIIGAFHQEVYGETVLPDQQLHAARFAWRKLRSPLRWPSRLKTWFLKQDDR